MPTIFKSGAWYTVRYSLDGCVLFRSLERPHCKAWIVEHYMLQNEEQEQENSELNALFS